MVAAQGAITVPVGVLHIGVANAGVRHGLAELQASHQATDGLEGAGGVIGADQVGQTVADAQAVVPVGTVIADPDVHILAQLGFHLRFKIGALDRGALIAAADVLDEALALPFLAAAHLEAQIFGHRQGDHAFDPGVVVIGDRGADLAGVFIVGTLGDLVDRAAHGVAAIQGALGAPQDLGALDEQRRLEQLRGTGRIEAV